MINKALYTSGDNRYNPHELPTLKLDQETATQMLRQTKSVACLVADHFLAKCSDHYRMQGVPSLATDIKNHPRFKGLSLDPHERFKNEPCMGSSTAFLVTKDLVLTAAHCVYDTDSSKLDKKLIASTLVVFDFQMDSETSYATTFPKQNVYAIDEVVAYHYANCWGDWALLRLDREVVGRTPLSLDFDTHVKVQAPLYMLGHPYGLPMKITVNGTVKGSQHRDYFECNLDAFAGNSGSPVFDSRSHKVVGILCSGNTDFSKETGSGGTYVAAYHVKPHEGWERCQRITAMRDFRSIVEAPKSNKTFQSRFDPSKSVDANNWAVTWIATPSEHAGIIVESVQHGEFCTRMAHYLSPLYFEGTQQEKVGDAYTVFGYGRLGTVEVKYLKKIEFVSKSQTWIRSAEKVKKMLKQVESEEEDSSPYAFGLKHTESSQYWKVDVQSPFLREMARVEPKLLAEAYVLQKDHPKHFDHKDFNPFSPNLSQFIVEHPVASIVGGIGICLTGLHIPIGFVMAPKEEQKRKDFQERILHTHREVDRSAFTLSDYQDCTKMLNTFKPVFVPGGEKAYQETFRFICSLANKKTQGFKLARDGCWTWAKGMLESINVYLEFDLK